MNLLSLQYRKRRCVSVIDTCDSEYLYSIVIYGNLKTTLIGRKSDYVIITYLRHRTKYVMYIKVT